MAWEQPALPEPQRPLASASPSKNTLQRTLAQLEVHTVVPGAAGIGSFSHLYVSEITSLIGGT